MKVSKHLLLASVFGLLHTTVAMAQMKPLPPPQFALVEKTLMLKSMPTARINQSNAYCLGQDVRNNNGPELRYMRNIRIQFTGESDTMQNGNSLAVTDRRFSGVPIAQPQENLPYHPKQMMVAVKGTAEDICFTSYGDGQLSNFTLTFLVPTDGGGMGPLPPPPQDQISKTPVLLPGVERQINMNTSYCLENDVRKNGGPSLMQMRDIKVSFKGESVSTQGNRLIVRDRNGQPLLGNDQDGLILPYSPNYVSFMVYRTKNDICLSAMADGRLSEMTVTYIIDNNGPVFPPQPPTPPMPPTPPVPPMPPPPPPPQQSDVRGQLIRVSQDGMISGWACDRSSAKDSNIQLIVNGESLSVQPASIGAYNQAEMGSPLAYGCDINSGFKFQINPDRYAGQNTRIEVKVLSPFSPLPIPIGSMNVAFPALIVEAGVFNVGNDIFLSDGPQSSTYCHITTMDQVRILKQYYNNNQRSLSSRPKLMTERGVCELRPVKQGLFMSNNGSAPIYYSNGQDAYCHISSPDQIHGRPHPRLVDILPVDVKKPDGQPLQRFDGICAPQ